MKWHKTDRLDCVFSTVLFPNTGGEQEKADDAKEAAVENKDDETVATVE